MSCSFLCLQNPQIKHQATHKVGCQSGDCRWPFNLPQGFVWVGVPLPRAIHVDTAPVQKHLHMQMKCPFPDVQM